MPEKEKMVQAILDYLNKIKSSETLQEIDDNLLQAIGCIYGAEVSGLITNADSLDFVSQVEQAAFTQKDRV